MFFSNRVRPSRHRIDITERESWHRTNMTGEKKRISSREIVLVVFLSHIASVNCPACASFSTTLGARHSPDQAKTHGAGEQDGNKIRHSWYAFVRRLRARCMPEIAGDVISKYKPPPSATRLPATYVSTTPFYWGYRRMIRLADNRFSATFSLADTSTVDRQAYSFLSQLIFFSVIFMHDPCSSRSTCQLFIFTSR